MEAASRCFSNAVRKTKIIVIIIIIIIIIVTIVVVVVVVVAFVLTQDTGKLPVS